MKLFKNGVGRPSNEILRKRKIFVTCSFLVCTLLVFGITFAIKGTNVKNIKGTANKKCDVWVDGVTDNTVTGVKAKLHYNCNNNKVKSVKLYNNKGAKINSYNIPSKSGVSGYITINGLSSSNNYKVKVNVSKGSDVVYNFDTYYYTIKFNKGDANEGSMSNQKIYRYNKTKLKKLAYSHTKMSTAAYKFLGWKAVRDDVFVYSQTTSETRGWLRNPSANKIVKLSDEYAVYKFGRANKNDTITLYPIWKKVAPSKVSYLSSKNFVFVNKKISHDDNTLLKGIRKDIGKQYASECYSAAATYAVYIIKNGKKPKYLNSCKTSGPSDGTLSPERDKTNKWDVKTDAGWYSLIVDKINIGSPVVVHLSWRGGGREHWVTVTGYRFGVDPKKMKLSDLFAIDPTPRNGVIIHDVITKLPVDITGINSDRDMVYWNELSDACYTGEC